MAWSGSNESRTSTSEHAGELSPAPDRDLGKPALPVGSERYREEGNEEGCCLFECECECDSSLE